MTTSERLAGEVSPLVLLSGGGGGAKLAGALSAVATSRPVIVITNTGDDFEHLGLLICPDTDSVMYAASGKIDSEKGWGRAGESWEVFDTLKSLDGPDWFQLGDKDLALHLLRAEQLRMGRDLATATQLLSARLGVPDGMTVVPATEQPVRTRVVTEEGELAFQEYFVGRHCEPVLLDVVYEGIEGASPSPSLLAALDACGDVPVDIVLGPSNPFLSLGPILGIPAMLSELRTRARRIVAISPIIGGRALKGPAAKIMTELGLPASALGWTQWLEKRYPGFVDTWVWDEMDHELIKALSPPPHDVRVTSTVMSEPGAGQAFAQWLLEVCGVAP